MQVGKDLIQTFAISFSNLGLILGRSPSSPEIYCYDRVDWRSFNHDLHYQEYFNHNLSEKPYFWSLLQTQKYFNHYLSEKPYFWSFLQYQKYFNHNLSEKPYFWLLLLYQKYFTHDLSEKPYFWLFLQYQKYKSPFLVYSSRNVLPLAPAERLSTVSSPYMVQNSNFEK